MKRAFLLWVSLVSLVWAAFTLGCSRHPDSDATMLSSGSGSSSSPLAAPAAPAPHAQSSAPSANQANIMSNRTYQKPSADVLKKTLSPLQYRVTQEDATEPAFRNEFWDNHAEGLYVDIATGEPLFSSLDKFESGTGWPSFTRPVDESRVTRKVDRSWGMTRVEARSKAGDSHLGHIFEDGPAPTGLRYCINSASLRFIPVDKLEAEGYGEYKALFASGATHPPAKTDNACAPKSAASGASSSSASSGAMSATAETSDATKGASCNATIEEAVLAGGCFWGMEELLRKIPGVIDTEVGYAGGTTANPNYEQVKTGSTGHAESVRILFDPQKLAYADLLEKWFFKMHDPTTLNRQGNDVGTQYRSAIFYTTPEQKKIAEQVKAKVEASGKWKRPITTEIVKAGPFTKAEDYHQDYLQKHPGGYSCHFMRD